MKKPIIEVIEKHQSADKPAIIFEQKIVTYKALHEQSDRLANYLLAQFQQTDALNKPRVALYMQPSDDYVIALLAVLKAGLEFIPLDVNRTREELDECLKIAETSVVLTDKKYHQVLTSFPSRVLIENFYQEQAGQCDPHFLQDISSSDFAYIIYTSGSSGKPKAVHVRHDAIMYRVNSIAEKMQISETDCYAQLCSNAFDASLQEIFVALSAGACLKIVPDHQRNNAPGLMKALESVTLMSIVPSKLALLNVEQLNAMRVVLTTGSSLPDELAIELINKDIKILNGYGATEDTFGSHLGWIELVDGQVLKHLGEPMQGIAEGFRILSNEEDDDELSEGEVLALLNKAEAIEKLQENPAQRFELVTYVTEGKPNEYLNPEAVKRQVFVEASIDDHQKKAYLTSDIVTLNADGKIIYLGRLGASGKRYGQLIDFEKINQLLSQRADECNIEQAYAVVNYQLDPECELEEKNDLVIFYTVKNKNFPVDFHQLNNIFAYGMLQEYPTHAIRLDEMPISRVKNTMSRGLLINYYQEHKPEKVVIRGVLDRALSGIEKQISTIWQEVLHLEGFSFRPDDNFLNFCPDSLMLKNMLSKVTGFFSKDKLFIKMDGEHLSFDQRPGYRDFMIDPTLSRLAREIIQWLDLEKYEKKSKEKLHKISLKPLRLPDSPKLAVVLIHSLSGSASTDYSSQLLNAYQQAVGDVKEVAVFCLDAPVMNGADEMPVSMEELARHYIVAIKAEVTKHQLQHVRIVGWSLGGVLAYEILSRLENDGKFSGAMIDSAAPVVWQELHSLPLERNLDSKTNFRSVLSQVPERMKWNCPNFKDHFLGVKVKKPKKSKKAKGGKHSVLFAQASSDGLPTINDKYQEDKLKNKMILLQEFKALIQEKYPNYRKEVLAVYQLMQAMLNYQPIRLNKSIDLYIASEKEAFLTKKQQGFLGWSSDMVVAQEVSGVDHMSIVREFNLWFSREKNELKTYYDQCSVFFVKEWLRSAYQQNKLSVALTKAMVDIDELYVMPNMTACFDGQELTEGHENVVGDDRQDNRAIKMAEFFDNDRIIIYAEQGVGKTALLQYVRFQWSKDVLSEYGIDLMFFIPLSKIKTYVEKYKNDKFIDFLIYVLNDADKKTEDFLKLFFDKKFPTLKACFLLDAYDEAVACQQNDSYESRLLRSLLDLQHTLIITTQEKSLLSLRESLPKRDNVKELEVHLLGMNSLSLVDHFVEKVFPLLARGVARRDHIELDDQKTQLIRWLKSNYKNYKNLLNKPLLLLMICKVFFDGVDSAQPVFSDTKNSMILFYDRLTKKMLQYYLVDHHALSEGLSESDVLATTKPIFDLLMDIAFNAYDDGSSRFEEELFIKDYCSDKNAKSFENQNQLIVNRKNDGSTKVFEYTISGRRFEQLVFTGFVVLDEGRGVHFLHDSLRFYLAAKYIVNFLQIQKDSWDNKVDCLDENIGRVLNYFVNEADISEHCEFLFYVAGILYEYDSEANLKQSSSGKYSFNKSKQAKPEKQAYLLKFFYLFENKIKDLNFFSIVKCDQFALPAWLKLVIFVVELGELYDEGLAKIFMQKFLAFCLSFFTEGSLYVHNRIVRQLRDVLVEHPVFLEKLKLIDELKEQEKKENRAKVREAIPQVYRVLEIACFSFDKQLSEASREQDICVRLGMTRMMAQQIEYLCFDLKAQERRLMLSHLNGDSNPLPVFDLMMLHAGAVDIAFFQAFKISVEKLLAVDYQALSFEEKRLNKTVLSDVYYTIEALAKQMPDWQKVSSDAKDLGLAILSKDPFDKRPILKLKWVQFLFEQYELKDKEECYRVFVAIIQLFSRINEPEVLYCTKLKESGYVGPMTELKNVANPFYDRYKLVLRKKIIHNLKTPLVDQSREYVSIRYVVYVKPLFEFLLKFDKDWLLEQLLDDKFSQDNVMGDLAWVAQAFSVRGDQRFLDRLREKIKPQVSDLVTTKIRKNILRVNAGLSVLGNKFEKEFSDFFSRYIPAKNPLSNWNLAANELLDLLVKYLKAGESLKDPEQWYQWVGQKLKIMADNDIHHSSLIISLICFAECLVVKMCDQDLHADLLGKLETFLSCRDASVAKQAVKSILTLFETKKLAFSHPAMVQCVKEMLLQLPKMTRAIQLFDQDDALRYIAENFSTFHNEAKNLFEFLLTLLNHHLVVLRIAVCRHLLKMLQLDLIDPSDKPALEEAMKLRAFDFYVLVRLSALSVLFVLNNDREAFLSDSLIQEALKQEPEHHQAYLTSLATQHQFAAIDGFRAYCRAMGLDIEADAAAADAPLPPAGALAGASRWGQGQPLSREPDAAALAVPQ